MKQIIVNVISGTENDLAANAAAFRTAYLNYVSESKTEESTIGAAVHALFDKHRGASLTMGYLSGTILRESLNCQPENHASLEKRVLTYIRNNADRWEKKDKHGLVTQVADPDRTHQFRIGRGKGAGVYRWSDKPVSAPSDVDTMTDEDAAV